MKKSKAIKAHKSLVHPSFPDQGAIQPSYMGSQSMLPPTSPESQAPQMPSYDNTQTAPSGEY